MSKSPVQFFILLLLPVACLWFVLINHLRVEWAVNPQYSYGKVVPFLCLYLLWRRSRQPEIGVPGEIPSSICYFLFAFCALLYAPTRLIQVANPEWRLVSWTLAIEVIGLTLLTIYFAFGSRVLARYEFPICYFFVAVPWPTLIEEPLIQGLTRLDTNAVAELLGWIGIPAMPHGNVIEVATGVVGIDEACSGIRSFQATLMISLFLGEIYRLGTGQRLLLVTEGFLMAFSFNVVRSFLLTYIAASQGMAAIASWHDPAGVTILVVCFICLWLVAAWFCKKQGAKNRSQGAEACEQSRKEKTESKNAFQLPVFKNVRRLAIALLVWLVLVEVGVEWWYRSHEAHVQVAAQWDIAWPVDNPAFKELPLPEQSRQILRYDEGRSAVWLENNLTWQAVFLRWKPGQTAVHLAQNHTPDVCLSAAGHTLKSISVQEWFEVNGLRMPFSFSEVMDTPKPAFIFYCLWNDRANTQGFETMLLTYGNRLAPVLAGVRNPGQRSLEIAVTGSDSPAQASIEFRRELQKLVR